MGKTPLLVKVQTRRKGRFVRQLLHLSQTINQRRDITLISHTPSFTTLESVPYQCHQSLIALSRAGYVLSSSRSSSTTFKKQPSSASPSGTKSVEAATDEQTAIAYPQSEEAACHAPQGNNVHAHPSWKVKAHPWPEKGKQQEPSIARLDLRGAGNVAYDRNPELRSGCIFVYVFREVNMQSTTSVRPRKISVQSRFSRGASLAI